MFPLQIFSETEFIYWTEKNNQHHNNRCVQSLLCESIKKGIRSNQQRTENIPAEELFINHLNPLKTILSLLN